MQVGNPEDPNRSTPAVPMMQQMVLGGGIEAPKEDEYPPEIQESLKILSGNHPSQLGNNFGSRTPDNYPLQEQSPLKGPFPETSRDKFIKQGDKVVTKVICHDPKVKVLDLATEDGEKEYEKILGEIGDPKSGLVLTKTIHPPIIDLKNNIRVIAVLEWFRPEMKKEIKRQQFDEASAAAVAEKIG